MNVLMAGSFLFGVAFLTHLVVWKFRIPRNPIKTILSLFVIVLVVGVLILRYGPLNNSMVEEFALFSFSECIHVVLFFMALFSTYYFVYGVLVDDSPSMFTMMNVAKAGEKGLSKDELSELITDDLFIKPRIDYLVDDQMVVLQGEKYVVIFKREKFHCYYKFFSKYNEIIYESGLIVWW